MIIVVDNYDSFTFNLVQYLAVSDPDVVVVRNDQFEVAELLSRRPHRIVISPGPGAPVDAGRSLELILANRETPLLGVCLGHQSLAEAFGGRIVRAPTLMHGKVSEIFHDGRGIFRDLPSPLVATRYHSLIVDRQSLPEELEVSAETADGLIMGLRHRELPMEGVQFHPESILTTEGHELIANFTSELCDG